MKLGLIKELKVPQDSRVVLNPEQVKKALEKYSSIEIGVQPSEHRCYSDQEYADAGIPLISDLSNFDILIGVKEIQIESLIANKTYLIFSHTLKAQPHNRKLLQAILAKNIRLIDYECLVNESKLRVIAFGRWAGIVGAHNGLYTWGKRTGLYNLKRAKDCTDYSALIKAYKNITLPTIKIAVTGNGRVANGAVELLKAIGVKEVNPNELISKSYNSSVFAQLDCDRLYERKRDKGYSNKDFFQHPETYNSTFKRYFSDIDLFINGIFWNPKAPAFFSKEDMAKESFRIKVIADITCDIAPFSSIPSTLRSTSIDSPVFGYDPFLEKEITPYQSHSIDVMSIDNLSNELPRDASDSFGEQFLEFVLPELIKPSSAFLDRATIAKNGKLTPAFEYLSAYVEEK